MRWMSVVACSLPLFASVTSTDAQPAPAKTVTPSASAPAALLPESFAGWRATDSPKAVTDAAQADPAAAQALKEYDFTDAMVGDYKRGGETASLRALRFKDAS